MIPIKEFFTLFKQWQIQPSKIIVLEAIVNIFGCIQLAKLLHVLIHVVPESTEMLVKIGVVVVEGAGAYELILHLKMLNLSAYTGQGPSWTHWEAKAASWPKENAETSHLSESFAP